MRHLLIAAATATLASHAAAQSSGDSPVPVEPQEMGSDSVRAKAQEPMLAPQASPLSHCLRFVPYPAMARLHRQQGEALLSFKVSANGTTESPTLVKSSGFSLLDKAAMDTLAFCTSNATQDDKSRLKPGQYLFPFTWRLE